MLTFNFVKIHPFQVENLPSTFFFFENRPTPVGHPVLFMARNLPAGIKRNGGLLRIGRIKIFGCDNQNAIERDF